MPSNDSRSYGEQIKSLVLRHTGISLVGSAVVLIVMTALLRGGLLAHSTYAPLKAASTTASNSFVVPELGISVALPVGLDPTDLVYSAAINLPGTPDDPALWSTLSFSTKSLIQLDSRCTAAEASIGVIARYSEDPATIHAHVLKTQATAHYYYSYAAPEGPCSDNPEAAQLQWSQINLLKQVIGNITEGALTNASL